jgi:hypothetical protein
MEKYLLQILKEVNTVIIPGLGALTIINDKSGEVMYMPYLKYDDGKFSSYIAEKKNISNDEAKKLISNNVENILNTIERGGTSSLNGFGVFSKDSIGEVCFTSNIVINPVEIDYEKSAIEEETKVLEKSIEIVEKVIEDMLIDENLPQENEISSHLKEDADILADEKLDKEVIIAFTSNESEAAREEKIRSLNEYTFEENFTVQAVNDEMESRDHEDEEIPESNLVKVKKNRGLGFFIIVLLIVLILGGGLAIGVNFKNVRQSIPFLSNAGSVKSEEEIIKKMELDKTKPTESEPLQGEELIQNSEEVISEISADSIIKEPVSTNSIPTSTKATSRNDSNDNKQSFYIVVGSFSDKQNADRAVDKLFKNGNKYASVSNHNEKFYATIANYSNIDDAISGQKSLKDSFPKSWILKH